MSQTLVRELGTQLWETESIPALVECDLIWDLKKNHCWNFPSSSVVMIHASNAEGFDT